MGHSGLDERCDQPSAWLAFNLIHIARGLAIRCRGWGFRALSGLGLRLYRSTFFLSKAFLLRASDPDEASGLYWGVVGV